MDCDSLQLDTPENLSKEMILALRARAQKSLYFFAKGILGFDYMVPRIHKGICKILESYEENHRIKICLPRGWLKTTLCSCAYPLWRAIRNCNVRVLLCQNTYTNACSKLGTIKGLVESNKLFRTLFPELLPTASCKWKADSLCLNRDKPYNESTFEAAGTRTQVTSRHYNLIIEDDTVAPEQDDLTLEQAVPSKEDIEKAIGWHKLAIPLLDTPGRDQLLVVGTRWAELDLLSYIDKEEPYFGSYQRACLEDEDGNADEQGIPQYPERFPREVLYEIKRSMGPYMFSALYMNSPMSSSAMTFRPEWFLFYETEPAHLAMYTTVDVAGDPEESRSKGIDYNVVMTTGKDLNSGHIYVVDYWREKANPGEVIDEIFRQQSRYHSLKVGIEGVAYQNTMIYWVKERMRKQDQFFNVECMKWGKKSKASRIQGLQPIMSNGMIHFRPWMKDLQSELVAFPMGAHDDLADTLSMQKDMWNLTNMLIKEDKKEEYNPFLFDNLLAEVTGRHDKPTGFPQDMYAA